MTWPEKRLTFEVLLAFLGKTDGSVFGFVAEQWRKNDRAE